MIKIDGPLALVEPKKRSLLARLKAVPWSIVISLCALCVSSIGPFNQYVRVRHSLTASVLGWEYDPKKKILHATVAFMNRGNQTEVVFDARPQFQGGRFAPLEFSDAEPIAERLGGEMVGIMPATVEPLVLDAGKVVVRQYGQQIRDEELKEALAVQAQSPTRSNVAIMYTFMTPNGKAAAKIRYFGILGLVKTPVSSNDDPNVYQNVEQNMRAVLIN